MTGDARISTGFPGHPKTKKLVRRLGPEAAWALVCLILWTRSNRPDGDLEGMSAEDIELACDWTGDADALVRELASVGFLDGEEGAYRLHDWADHQPWAAGSDMRSARARWNAVKRHHGAAEADRQVPEYAAVRSAGGKENDAAGTNSDAVSSASSNAGSTDAVMQDDERSNAPSPSPSPSPSPKATASLRSASPSAAPDGQPAPPVSGTAERLAQVTAEAIAAFNGSPLARAQGGNLPTVNANVGKAKRQGQVKRCLRVAREICKAATGSTLVTPEFWQGYFAAAAEDDFYSGRRQGGPGHEGYVPDFELLTREATMLRIFDRSEAAA